MSSTASVSKEKQNKKGKKQKYEKQHVHTLIILTLVMLNSDITNSVDPDQLASSEAN